MTCQGFCLIFILLMQSSRTISSTHKQGDKEITPIEEGVYVPTFHGFSNKNIPRKFMSDLSVFSFKSQFCLEGMSCRTM